VRFAWIKEHAKEFAVSVMCDALNVSISGYYAALGRKPSRRRQRREELVAQIRAAHEQSHQIYGSPRIYIELKEQGVAVCLNTVAKYMQQEQIRSKVKRPFRLLTPIRIIRSRWPGICWIATLKRRRRIASGAAT